MRRTTSAATQALVVLLLLCCCYCCSAGTLIRVGTQQQQRLADGSQAGDNWMAAALHSPNGVDASKFIDSGQRLVKRMPGGFIGMRGKKADDPGEFVDVADSMSPRFWQQVRNQLERITNRSPNNAAFSSFEYDDDYAAMPFGAKRAPVGFLGMRGKKNSPTPDGMPHLLEYMNDIAAIETNYAEYGGGDMQSSHHQAKRVPAAGFLGMRGKRDPPLELAEDYADIDEDLNSGSMVGSPSSSGIVGSSLGGIGGNHQLHRPGFKRVPPAGGFMGMRGKKVPAGFFGMRGKKIPVDFRGKFVGVRGKKVPGGRALRGEYTMPELQSAHVVEAAATANDANGSGGKRAPSGFLGMRGKKWMGTDDDSSNE